MLKHLLAAAIALVACAATPAKADWRASFKELRFGITSAENEADTLVRFDAFAGYMRAKLGVPVTVRRGNDYAAVVEALAARQVEFARMGPAAYA
ncbi:MAG: PhnD/SsuA/transferrin family substrate-binding protein, partial [Rhodospirillales bacterium]